MDKLIRIAIGVVVISFAIAGAYGLALLHTALGLSGTHYLYVGAAVAVTYVAYIIGDLVLVSHNKRIEK